VSPTVLERLSLYFSALHTRQALVARAAMGVRDVEDAGLAARLTSELAAEIRSDGSVGGAAVPTIWRVHELMDLGRSVDDPAVARAVRWILDRQGVPGAYGEGCDKTRHAQRVCQHYIAGFFSPAAATERLAPITLPNGKAFRAEPAARFAISCLALRAVLRAGVQDRSSVVRHLDSLRLLAEGWTEWNGFFAPDAIVAGIHALALGGPAYRATVERLVEVVASQQRLDGQWASADLFQTIEALVASDLPSAKATVRRAVRVLEERQRPDGSFGTTAQQERALIGVRALLWVGMT
jgi:hypothetical protein